MVDRWTTIDGAVVHFIDTAPGGTGPSIVVIPGFLSSTECFAQFAGALSSALRVVVVDMPGFGRSEAPTAAWSLPFCERFIERFMDAAGLTSTVLLGSSMGAGIAVQAAASAPARVDALVLLNPVGLRGPMDSRAAGPAGPRILSALDPLIPLLCALMPQFLVGAMLRAQVVDPGVLTADVRAAYWRPFRSVRGRRVVAQAARALIAHPALDHRVHEIRQPILIVEGSANPMGSPGLRDELARAIPGCAVEVLEGHGHILALEAPERLAETISLWLSGRDQRSEK